MMLNTSNDASRKVSTKENKKIENHDENLKSNIYQSDFIPLDKDFPPTKTPTRQQRDRSQQKFNNHKTSYYNNSNRYQTRGVYNGNNTLPLSKTGNNPLRGHHNKNTHTNYTGNLASNYPSLNAASNNYTRTKRKRDSSAISTHGGGAKNQIKNLSDPDTSAHSNKPSDELSEIATKEYQPKYNLSTKPKCTSQVGASQSLQETSHKEGIASSNEDCKSGNLDCSKRYSLNETKENPRNLKNCDCCQLTNIKEKLHNNSPISTQNSNELKNTSIQRSQEDVYLKSESSKDFSATKSHANKENTKNKSCLLNKDRPHDHEPGNKGNKTNAFASAQRFPVWHRGKPYGGGVIG